MVMYTTAAKVKAMLGDAITTVTGDADIEEAIQQVEGVINCWQKIGTGTGSHSLTFSTLKSPHNVLELAATCGAVLLIVGACTPSITTMEQAVMIRENAAWGFEEAKRLLTDKDESSGDFILEQ